MAHYAFCLERLYIVACLSDNDVCGFVVMQYMRQVLKYLFLIVQYSTNHVTCQRGGVASAAKLSIWRVRCKLREAARLELPELACT